MKLHENGIRWVLAYVLGLEDRWRRNHSPFLHYLKSNKIPQGLCFILNFAEVAVLYSELHFRKGCFNSIMDLFFKGQ